MLYVTTRNKNDAHTAHKTLISDRASDGGFYVPFQMPAISTDDLLALKDKTFGQSVAEILNLFFSARLDGWDVDFCIGRYPVKLIPMSHRIVVGESWNNPDRDYSRMVRNLYSRICGNADSQGVPSDWAQIAIRIATLFGLYGQMLQKGLVEPGVTFDVSVTAGDFSCPMALWYAREMGLPVGTIICACNENSGLWEFLHHGQIRTDVFAQPTNTPCCDYAVPVDLERLVYGCLGTEGANLFAEASNSGATYSPDEQGLSQLKKGIFAAVISQKRMESVICNVYRTGAYLLDPYGALAYGALQDYRATVGEGRVTLLLTDRSPICSAATVSKALGISVHELKDRLSFV